MVQRLQAAPATTVLPALNPTLAARLFPDSSSNNGLRQQGGGPPRRVWSLPENCVPQLVGGGTLASRHPPQGFVAVTNPSSTSAADDRAVLLVDPTLSPPIRVVCSKASLAIIIIIYYFKNKTFSIDFVSFLNIAFQGYF